MLDIMYVCISCNADFMDHPATLHYQHCYFCDLLHVSVVFCVSIWLCGQLDLSVILCVCVQPQAKSSAWIYMKFYQR